MTRVALRGLAARKLRALTTCLAIFLGVAFVAGSYVLTDTINHSFDEIFEESLKGTDVAITPRNDIQQEDTGPPPFSAALLPRVRAVDGVEAAAGSIFSLGRFVDAEGDPIGNQFAPNFISSHQPPRFESLNYVEGSPPAGPREASLDTQTADRAGLDVGDTLHIAGEEAVKSYRIVGMTKLGDTSFGGAGIAQLTLPEAQRVTDKVGKFDQISVSAEDGVSAAELRARIARALPPTVLVETGQQAAQRQSNDIADDLSFFNIVLLVFAGVSLFVGAFLIFNTFSITVAQRTREFGMLRTLGASRGQILSSVGLEALLLALLGSGLGVVGGIGLAKGINALLKSFGIDLPNTGTVILPRTIIVSLVVGLVVTGVSALAPALRSTRVTPMAALQESELTGTRSHGWIVPALALLLGAGGFVLTCVGLFGGVESGGGAAGLIGGGAVMVLLGVSLYSPRLVRPLAALFGRPIEALAGITGRLARENTMRKPGRTAATSAALMIGLALVVFVAVFAAGISKSVGAAVDRNIQGDLILQNIDGFSPIPAKAVQAAGRVPGVETRSAMYFSSARIVSPVSGSIQVSGVDPATISPVLTLDWKQGSQSLLRRLGPNDAVVDDGWANGNGIDVGDRLIVRTPAERTVAYTVRGTAKDNTADLIGNLLVPSASLRSLYARTAPSVGLIGVRDGVDVDRVQKAMEGTVERRFPTVEVQNQQQLKDRSEEQVNQLVGLVYALLALAIVVAVFGIVNTLMLSIHERTRELGMLRAVGMSRRQVRRMMRYEAVITALIGALLGLILGVIFAALVSRPLADEGFELAYPVGTLVILLVVAAILGVVAAIGPARRAARLDVLQAVAYE
jgi:putative ABC transport system permease protein